MIYNIGRSDEAQNHPCRFGNSQEKNHMLYITTGELHNNTEELSVFSRRNFLEEEVDATEKHRKIVHQSGLDKYLGVTGFSERLLKIVA